VTKQVVSGRNSQGLEQSRGSVVLSNVLEVQPMTPSHIHPCPLMAAYHVDRAITSLSEPAGQHIL
jgi:hypothetical protein